MKKIAAFAAKEIRMFWTNVEKVSVSLIFNEYVLYIIMTVHN